MDLRTLLACCKCAKQFSHEYDLSGDVDTLGVTLMRTLEHRRMVLEEFDEMTNAVRDKNWVNIFSCVLLDACHKREEEFLPPKRKPWIRPRSSA